MIGRFGLNNTAIFQQFETPAVPAQTTANQLATGAGQIQAAVPGNMFTPAGGFVTGFEQQAGGVVGRSNFDPVTGRATTTGASQQSAVGTVMLLAAAVFALMMLR